MNLLKSITQLFLLSMGLSMVILAEDAHWLEFVLRTVGLVLMFLALDWRYMYRDKA